MGKAMRMRVSGRRRDGFSLLEISLVLAIIAVIIGGGITMFSASLQARQYQETQMKMKALQQALYNFRLANNRVPCPADITIAPTAANFGIEAANPGVCTEGTPQANFAGGTVSTNTVTYVKTDTTTEGSWVGVYGADGYFIAGVGSSLPAYLISQPSSGITTTSYSNPCGTIPCVQKAPPNQGVRVATAWTTTTVFTVPLNTNVVPPTTKQVAWYMFDYNNGGGGELDNTIVASDATTGVVLDVRTIPLTSTGKWVVYAVSGDIKFTFINPNTLWLYASASAEMFDPSGIAAPTDYGTMIEGMVPTAALGLPDAYAFDGWGHRIEYAVSTPGTGYNAFSTITASDSTTRLTVNDASGNARTTNAMYVLLSAGPNGYGAFPRIGGSTRIQTGGVNVNEQNNCDCNNTGPGGAIAATTFDGVFVQKLPTQDPTTPNHTNDFDDIVVYGRRGIELRSPKE
jgi:prepilin-type N-terminal cleavage/methylation domain-containing protein